MPLGDQAAPTPAPARGMLAALGDIIRPRQRLVPLARLGLPGGAAQAAVRAMAQAVPMAGGTLLCRTLGRHKMLVDAADFTHAPHLAMDGFWEWWTTRFLSSQLRPGEVVVDGGACYGYFSLLAAELVGPTGRVLAFEPNPRMASLLRRNLTLNGMEDRVMVEEVALAGPDSGRVARLVVPEGSPMNAHLQADEPEAATDAAGAMPLVATRPLDRHAALRPDFIKLDICGAEEAAWEGMQGLIAANPALRVLLNFNPARCDAPTGFLDRIAGQFPLRRLAADGTAQPCTIPDALRGGDVMLFLAREAPG